MINNLGTEGWELVFARRASLTTDITRPEYQYEMIFRRPAGRASASPFKLP
jgi:hypothetical protein